MAAAISCMRSMPAGFFRIQLIDTPPYTSASRAHSMTIQYPYSCNIDYPLTSAAAETRAVDKGPWTGDGHFQYAHRPRHVRLFGPRADGPVGTLTEVQQDLR